MTFSTSSLVPAADLDIPASTHRVPALSILIDAPAPAGADRETHI